MTGASPADPPTPPIDIPATSPPDIPVTPPTAGPPIPPPGLADLALNLVAAQHGLPLGELSMVNTAIAQYPHSGGTAFAYKAMDQRDGGMYVVTLDASGRELDAAQLMAAEQAAFAAKYGRLEPALFERLAGTPDWEPLEVVIWLKEPPYVGPPRPDPHSPITETQLQAFISFADISGCIRAHGAPQVERQVMLKQRGERRQSTSTDAGGCYTFQDTVLGKPFQILIRSPEGP